MRRHDGSAIDRRGFLRNAFASLVAARWGLHPAFLPAGTAIPASSADPASLMGSARFGISELNAFFAKSADEVGKARTYMRGMAQRYANFGAREYEAKDLGNASMVLDTLVGFIASLGIPAGASGGTAGATVDAAFDSTRLTTSLTRLADAEREVIKYDLPDEHEKSIKSAFAAVRKTVIDVRDSLVGRDILFRISRDRVYASRLLEALASGNRAAAESMLKSNVAGSNVTLESFTTTPAVNLTLRASNYIYCLSTASQCKGKEMTFRR